MTKVVLLAGGLGTRLSEETAIKPKPMVEIGGRPILWHIMKIYAAAGLTEFIVCCGYKGYIIKEYFANYGLHNSDVTFDLAAGATTVHGTTTEPWMITLVDTGELTMTGGRIKRIARHLPANEPFCLTYGDGVADIDVAQLLRFHRSHGKLATVSAVRPPGRFGHLDIDAENRVLAFDEKPHGDGQWINAGFFVLEPRVLDTIEGDGTVFEGEPMRELSARGELVSYRHGGFWQPMDTQRDRSQLEDRWSRDDAPWKLWS